MDSYVTSFCLPTLLEVNNIRATCVLSKNRSRKCIITGDKQLQKKEPGNSAHQTKNQFNFDSGWLE